MRTRVGAVDPLQVCPAPRPSWAQSGAGSCGTAPPPRSWKGYLPWGFNLQPRALLSSSARAAAAGAVEKERAPPAGAATLGRSTRGASWPARATPDAAAAALMRPPHAPSAPRSPPGRHCNSSAQSGVPWRPPLERQLRGGKRSLVAFRIL